MSGDVVGGHYAQDSGRGRSKNVGLGGGNVLGVVVDGV